MRFDQQISIIRAELNLSIEEAEDFDDWLDSTKTDPKHTLKDLYCIYLKLEAQP